MTGFNTGTQGTSTVGETITYMSRKTGCSKRIAIFGAINNGIQKLEDGTIVNNNISSSEEEPVRY